MAWWWALAHHLLVDEIKWLCRVGFSPRLKLGNSNTRSFFMTVATRGLKPTLPLKQQTGMEHANA
jgi:hypothetical protein